MANECLDTILGLKDVVASADYRRALDLPSEVVEEYTNFAHGEYNQNFLFTHPNTSQKFILRVERGSQMGLENQIEYEYSALKLLENSGRTPKVHFCDGSKKVCEHGVLVEEFLPGVKLDYTNQFHLSEAALIFADIHSYNFPSDSPLIKANNAFVAMLDECEKMAQAYFTSDVVQPNVKSQIDRLLAEANLTIARGGIEANHMSIVNTEVNNTNFLINEGSHAHHQGSHACSWANSVPYHQGSHPSYLIDWEKPLIADPAQDIGHFLADTTTFWKTDFFFTKAQKEDFVCEYIEKLAGRIEDDGLEERCLKFANFTCLRGITWCAMASVEYAHATKDILDPVTAEKLKAYLDVSYLKTVSL